MNHRHPLLVGCLLLAALFTATTAFAQRTATAVPTVVNGFVVSITLTDGGSGYSAAPTVTITGGNGSGATATATILNGAVNQVIVGNAGSGYTGTPAVSIAAPPSPKPPFSDGLLAYWPFNGDAADASGNGHNGTVTGASLTADRFGAPNKAYRFGGQNAYITAPIDNAFLAGDFTVSVWFNATDFANGWPTLLDIESFNLSVGGLLCGCSGPGHLISYSSFAPRTFSWFLDRADQTPVGTFNQVVITKAGSVATMYLNSAVEVQGVASSPTVKPGSSLWIGRSQASIPAGDNPAGYVFHGVLDDVRIYNRALSAQEVKDLYRYESPTPPTVSIKVETVQVTMHVTPAKRYQLMSSFDLKTWTNVGQPILAGSSEIPLTLNALSVGQFFRVYEVQ